MDNRFGSYSKNGVDGDLHSHTIEHESENDENRHRSNSRPPGSYAMRARPPGLGGVPPRSRSPSPPKKGGVSSARNTERTARQSSAIQKDTGTDGAIMLTRRRRWDSQRAETAKAMHSQPAPIAETKALRIVDASSGSDTGPKIRFGKFKAKGRHAAKVGKSAAKFRRASIARTASMLSMAASVGRQSREDSSVQDSGSQVARLARNTRGVAAQSARRMVRQIRARQYANAAEKSAKGAASAARGVKGVFQKIGYLFRAVAATGHVGLAIAAVIGLILITTVVTFSLLSLIFSGAAAGVNGSTMPANDADIDKAEAYYIGKEAALRSEVENAEQNHPGYNEYQYQIAGIGHNPVALVAYLSAMYGNFTFDNIKPKLDGLFASQYQLTFPTRSETRTRDVTTTDPATGQQTTTQEQYTYTIMTVNLVSHDFTTLVTPTLQQAGVLDVYTVYLQNHGNRMYFANPFTFGWSIYTTLASDNSASIDVPAGTEVKASLGGTVTQAADGTVIITGGDKLSVTYRGCTNIRVSKGQIVNAGEVIAQTGAGFSILFVRDNEHLNPYIFVDTGDSDSSTGTIVIGGNPLGGSVESYRQAVTQLAGQYGMSDYINLILAVMEQESGGRGSDPMQAAEGPFNTRFPKRPNGITDPVYSVQCGIQELKQNLQLAGATGPNDAAGIALALQGYNFGSGFISWAKNNGGYSLANAQAFAQAEAAALGWSSYGDPYYVPHVLRYYKQ